VGKIVALSGVDGTGKTTLARLLVKKLRFYKINVAYRHEFDYILILGPMKDKIYKLLGIRKSNYISNYMEHHFQKGTRLHDMVYFLAWFDYLLSYVYFRLRKGVVICDRWHYDHISHFLYKPRKNRLLMKLYSILPKPDVIILLDVDPEISHQRRKNDMDHPLWARELRYYVVQRLLMYKIAEVFKYDKIVDANRNLSEVEADVIDYLTKSRIDIFAPS